MGVGNFTRPQPLDDELLRINGCRDGENQYLWRARNEPRFEIQQKQRATWAYTVVRLQIRHWQLNHPSHRFQVLSPHPRLWVPKSRNNHAKLWNTYPTLTTHQPAKLSVRLILTTSLGGRGLPIMEVRLPNKPDPCAVLRDCAFSEDMAPAANRRPCDLGGDLMPAILGLRRSCLPKAVKLLQCWLARRDFPGSMWVGLTCLCGGNDCVGSLQKRLGWKPSSLFGAWTEILGEGGKGCGPCQSV